MTADVPGGQPVDGLSEAATVGCRPSLQRVKSKTDPTLLLWV